MNIHLALEDSISDPDAPFQDIVLAQNGLREVQFFRPHEALLFACGLIAASGRMWIYAHSHLPHAPDLVIVRDGKAFETVTLRPLQTGPEAEGRILTGSSACLLQQDMATKGRIHVVYAGQIIYQANVSYVPQFAGHIDRIQDGSVAGWAVDLARPQAAAEVDLLINGICYATRPCKIERQDIAALYPGHLVSGFDFSIALNEIDLPTLAVQVRFHGTPFVLANRAPHYRRPLDRRSVAPPLQLLARHRPVWVIVPVYNAAQDLRDCLRSLLRHTHIGRGGHRLLLSDDASPDPQVEQVLAAVEDHDGIVILRNRQNLGYTGNINHAIKAAKGVDPEADIVLLNSDTRVTPQWLELLQRCALQRSSIGTVSAVSDNAGAFSVPERNRANPRPPWLNEAQNARLVTQTSRLLHPRVPTTSGFCMYIRHDVFADIGLFNEVDFPRGYGEENDFCMRAGHLGWEHVIADNVLIYHERSASFLGSKTALIERASALIPQMYPEYGQAVYQGFGYSPEMNQMRLGLAQAQLRHQDLPRPRVAFVIGVESGGTPMTNMDLMASIQSEYEPYLILCTTGSLRIFRIIAQQRHEVEHIKLTRRVMPISHDSDSYRDHIADILQRYSFELVHIRHIGRHGLSLIRTAKELSIPVLFSLHDFYTICPNVKLLDAENRFCGGRCTQGGADCNVELWDPRFTPPLKHQWVQSWQKIFQQILPLCAGLITTSPYARTLIREIYALEDIRFDVIPHARDFEAFSQMAAPLIGAEKLRVLVPGHIVAAKGLDLIQAIKALDTHDKIEFHFLGTSKGDLSQYGISHGPYAREEFADRVAQIAPHLGAVLSIWPETYSHTLTEMWSCGVPVITSALGATGERIAQHGGGWALDDMQPTEVYAFLLGLISRSHSLRRAQSEVRAWQQGYGRDYNIAIMAERYKRLYRQTLHRHPSPETEVMVLSFGAVDRVEPVSHLRQILGQEGRPAHVMRWPSATLQMLPEVGLPDYLVIRYHDEPVGPQDPCDALTRAARLDAKMKLVLEISVDAFVGPDAETLATRPVLAWLLAHAAQIIGPPEWIEGAPLAPQIDLSPMLNDPADHARLPQFDLAAPSSVLPAQAISLAPHIAARLEQEVIRGGSACIFRHNAPLVTANFTLIDWDAMLTQPRQKGLVSLVMPTFNRVALTEAFLRSILAVTASRIDYEVILLDNGSLPEARRQIEALAELSPKVRVVCAKVPLMFSVGCNYGASFAQGEYILFVNNDMEVVSPDWLERLIQPLRDEPQIGITGGRLLFADGSIQHAGLVFSDQSALAYHAFLGAQSEADYVTKARVMQAITGACLAVRATDWAKLRGFNPLFVNGCEDVDFCLRMQRVLQRDTLYVPEALLLHFEGKSPGRGRFILPNRFIFNQLWGNDLRPDDQALYRANGFTSVDYTPTAPWLAPQYQTLAVTLAPR